MSAGHVFFSTFQMINQFRNAGGGWWWNQEADILQAILEDFQMYCLDHQGVVGAADKLCSVLCLLLGSHNGNFLAGRMEANAYAILVIDVGLGKSG